jgi:hypothetical protein
MFMEKLHNRFQNFKYHLVRTLQTNDWEILTLTLIFFCVEKERRDCEYW